MKRNRTQIAEFKMNKEDLEKEIKKNIDFEYIIIISGLVVSVLFLMLCVYMLSF